MNDEEINKYLKLNDLYILISSPLDSRSNKDRNNL